MNESEYEESECNESECNESECNESEYCDPVNESTFTFVISAPTSTMSNPTQSNQSQFTHTFSHHYDYSIPSIQEINCDLLPLDAIQSAVTVLCKTHNDECIKNPISCAMNYNIKCTCCLAGIRACMNNVY